MVQNKRSLVEDYKEIVTNSSQNQDDIPPVFSSSSGETVYVDTDSSDRSSDKSD